MRSFSRPNELTLTVTREPVPGTCPECGGALAAYPVVSEGGWWNVVKCQTCLTSVERIRGPLYGKLSALPHRLWPLSQHISSDE